MTITLLFWIAFIGGFIAGLFVMFLFISRINVAGTLKIDHHNPEKDVYRFVIDDFDVLMKKKRIILKVDDNADLSRK